MMICIHLIEKPGEPIQNNGTISSINRVVLNFFCRIEITRVDATTTACKMYYTIQHPCTADGFVPLLEFAKCLGTDINQLCQVIRQEQTRERKLFREYFIDVLARTTGTGRIQLAV